MSIFTLSTARALPSHRFMVFIGIMMIPFNKVSSIEVGIDTEVLMEGGENHFVHSLSKPASAEKSLVLERGVASDALGAALSTVANAFLRVGSKFSSIGISVLDQNGMPKKLYFATGAILKKRRFSDLDAMSGQVFVESLEFSYQSLTEVPGVGILFGGAQAISGSVSKKRIAEQMEESRKNPKRTFTLPKEAENAKGTPPPPYKFPEFQQKKAERFTKPVYLLSAGLINTIDKAKADGHQVYYNEYSYKVSKDRIKAVNPSVVFTPALPNVGKPSAIFIGSDGKKKIINRVFTKPIKKEG